MTEIFTILIAAFIIVFLGWLFLYLPVMGFAYIYLGEFALGLLYLLPLMGLIGVLLYRHFVIEPERRRWAALSRMYNFPRVLSKNDTADKWHNGFKAAIHGGLVTSTDSDKQTDLAYCQQIVERMRKDNNFDDLHRAFRLTGCHLDIKDPSGHTITQIV